MAHIRASQACCCDGEPHLEDCVRQHARHIAGAPLAIQLVGHKAGEVGHCGALTAAAADKAQVRQTVQPGAREVG